MTYTALLIRVIPNQHFKSTLLGGGEGVTKKSTLCTLVKMMTIMDDPLPDWMKCHVTYNNYYKSIMIVMSLSITSRIINGTVQCNWSGR